MTPEARKMMQHEHGGAAAVEKHAPEIGHKMKPSDKNHGHAPGAKPHKN